MADFAELRAEVERNRSVTGSAIELLNGIAARVEAAVAANDAGDQSALASLASDLRADVNGLASAVAANTEPVPPTPEPPPPGTEG